MTQSSHDDLIVKHIRLCECGLPAGHDSICKPGRVAAASRIDREWTEQNTEKRRVKWEKRSTTLNHDRRQQRDQLSEYQLHQLARQRAAQATTVSAGSIEPSRRGSQHPSVNLAADHRAAQTLDDDPAYRSAWGIVRYGLQRVHDILDAHDGHGIHATTELTTEARNRIVLEQSVGLSCAEAAHKLPEHTNGRAAVVATIRRLQGTGMTGDVLHRAVSIIDGRPK